MYYMKDICDKLNISYSTLKFYCNKGLIPNLKRDGNNYRIFDDKDLSWINSLHCLKNCGLSIKEMQHYVELVQIGDSTNDERLEMLLKRKAIINDEIKQMKKNLEFIEWKENYYKNKK